MAVRIGGAEFGGSVVQGPMAGVCDYAFREICIEHGAAAVYSEMISAKALVYRDKKTFGLMKKNAGVPFFLQLFGSDPDAMAEAAEIAAQYAKPDFIDINMGCPMKKIVSNGEGAALMQNSALAESIISALSRRQRVPVTVKIRSGWDRGHVNAAEFSKMAEGAGAAAVCVHGRTREQLFAGAADWTVIESVKKAVKIPVLANGDIFSAPDALRARERTGADLFVTARGAMGNPWLIPQAEAALSGRDIPQGPTLKQRISTAERHVRIAAADKGERTAVLEARAHIAWYFKGLRGIRRLRGKISAVSSLAEIWALLNEIAVEADREGDELS